MPPKKSKSGAVDSTGNPVDGAVDATSSTGGVKNHHRRTGDIRPAEKNSMVWLLSFTDIMALMLTFFVLLFSMTEPAKKEWGEITGAMQSEFNKFYGAVATRGPQDYINIEKINFNQALNIGYLSALMETIVRENPQLEQATLTPQPGQLVISLPRELLFDPGDAKVKEQGSRALYALGGTLSRIRNKIEIIGHADPRPVGENNPSYDSNWDLSLMRAANVAAILENVGYQSDIAIRGHSSGLYEDLQGRMDDEARLQLARRVDIIVMNHDGSLDRMFEGIVIE